LRTAMTDPERPAIVGPERVTYEELAARAGALTQRLISGGLEPGDRVALVSGNDVAFVVAHVAILEAGGVVAPLNVTSPAQELRHQLVAIEPSGVLAAPEHVERVRRALAQDAQAPPITVLDDAARPASDDQLGAPVPRGPDDLAVLLFTAGTAGSPKPAMLTHGSLLANLEQIQEHPGMRIVPEDVALAALPFFHVYGLNVVLHLALFAGASVSLIEHFHPAETLARVRRDGVTVVAAVPAIYAAWLALDPASAPGDALQRVRLCVSGASTLDHDVVAGMRDRFGVVVHDGYGLTEASPVVTTTAVTPGSTPGSIGPPLPGVEVRLVDGDGNDVLDGDPGEILVRGANVFAGYWNDDVASARVLQDGWLHTGDIAVADGDGWLALVDRAKDVVIVSGFNVFPGEVEEVLAEHPDVADVAVVGEPHPRTGETVVAYVVPRAGARVDPVELLRFGGRRLARYKLPTRVEVTDALPRTFAGKVLRRALSERTTRAPDATTNPA
jgi:long-chain acyl-CoA synthetase